MRKHHELPVWQYSMKLVKHVYRITADFPNEETFEPLLNEIDLVFGLIGGLLRRVRKT